MEVSVMKKEDACEGRGKTNIFIASFTTALARLNLYEELDKLGEQVLYYDVSFQFLLIRFGMPSMPIVKPVGFSMPGMTDVDVYHNICILKKNRQIFLRGA